MPVSVIWVHKLIITFSHDPPGKVCLLILFFFFLGTTQAIDTKLLSKKRKLLVIIFFIKVMTSITDLVDFLN